MKYGPHSVVKTVWMVAWTGRDAVRMDVNTTKVLTDIAMKYHLRGVVSRQFQCELVLPLRSPGVIRTDAFLVLQSFRDRIWESHNERPVSCLAILCIPWMIGAVPSAALEVLHCSLDDSIPSLYKSPITGHVRVPPRVSHSLCARLGATPPHLLICIVVLWDACEDVPRRASKSVVGGAPRSAQLCHR